MVTEKEFNIIKALVDEETELLRSAESPNSNILTNYLSTLSNIVEKLQRDAFRKKRLVKNDGLALHQNLQF